MTSTDAASKTLATERLRLRRWRPEDREPFAAINADPEVMQFYPAPMSRRDSDALIDRIEAHFEAHDFGLWALEIPGIASFAGFVGLMVPRFEASFTPCVEIGWRVASSLWRRGYATEAARAALDYGFGPLGLDEILAFTVPANTASRRVMEKLGMTHHPADDFDHPSMPEGSPLRPHVLYRIGAPG